MGNYNILHNGFNFYWLLRFQDQKNILVLTAIQKDLPSKIIFEKQTNLANHPYCLVVNVKKLYHKIARVLQKT